MTMKSLEDVYLKHFHYSLQNIDVSAVRELIKIVNPNYTKQETKRKNYNHRAEDDILETFNELKAYRKQ